MGRDLWNPGPVAFRWWLVAAAGIGAAIRLTYLHGYPSRVITGVSGDGIDYHVMALGLADGDGYIDGFRGGGGENAHHPPGWVTLLAGVTKAGGESIVAHQRVGVAIGIALIVVTGALGAKVFGTRTGVIAAFIAALYPGFWALEAQILAEPLALFLLGVSLLLTYRLTERPTWLIAAMLGLSIGLGILVRSEQAAVFAIVVPFAVIRAPSWTTRRKLGTGGLIGCIALLLLVPWTAHNLERFEEPVFLSTNLGPTLLAGNCNTYSGDLMGFFDTRCGIAISMRESPDDRSVLDRRAREVAIDNMTDNLGRLPVTMVARVGRALGLYAPGQTVDLVAGWHGTAEWPVWSWVVSYWLLVVLAVHGAVVAHRRGIWILPLVAPVVVAFAIILVFYGEPRYHTPADLGVVVLAAWSIAVSTGAPVPAERPARGRESVSTRGGPGGSPRSR